jgi:hypothetical protein
VVAHLTVGERVARGKAARSEVSRSSHAVFEPSGGRPDPVALLEGPRCLRPTHLRGCRSWCRFVMAGCCLIVYVLSRRHEDHGPRPRCDARSGLQVQMLRRRALVELRAVRSSRASARRGGRLATDRRAHRALISRERNDQAQTFGIRGSGSAWVRSEPSSVPM